MRTRDVPHEQWKPFLSGFASRHRGEAIHIEIVGVGEEAKSVLCGTPLVDIAAGIENDRIEVIAGAASESQTHSIGHPTRLSVYEADDGNAFGVEITADDGCVTSLRVDPFEMHDALPGYYFG